MNTRDTLKPNYRTNQADAPEHLSIRDIMPSFDDMAHLAKTDPDAFEALRADLCERVIAQAPSHLRQRLRGLQFKIDMERKRCQSSMGACIRISKLMNESLLKLNAALSNPRAYLDQYYSHSAEVIGLCVGHSEA